MSTGCGNKLNIHNERNFSDFFSDRLLLLVIKFYIINFNMMLMIMIYAVLIHWLNLFQYVSTVSVSAGSKFTYDNVSDLIVHFALLDFFLRYLHFIFSCTFVLIVRLFHIKSYKN